MWRALFSAVGIMLIVLGVECFLFDKVEVSTLNEFRNSATPTSHYQNASYSGLTSPAKTITYDPADWIPWTLLATGTIILIYTQSFSSHRSD